MIYVYLCIILHVNNVRTFTNVDYMDWLKLRMPPWFSKKWLDNIGKHIVVRSSNVQKDILSSVRTY